MIIALLWACAPRPCDRTVVPRDLPSVVEVFDRDQPVDIACFVHQHPRPLQLAAARSRFSAQPGSARSPRLFIFSGALITTIVPDGVGSDLLEFGEWVDATHTRKAELAMPIAGPLHDDALFERIRLEQGSTCSACHPDERADLASLALRPDPDDEVPLAFLRDEARRCRPADEPQRCAIFDAVFDGPVEAHPFPSHLPTLADLPR